VSETGSVKFTCQQVPVEIGAFAGFAELNEYRRKLRELGLIGVDANGVGFGNLSIRDGPTSRFYITGSATGGIADLIPSHLRESSCLRRRQKLAAMRRIHGCVIRITHTCGGV
jgi:hypothetical protein